MKATATYQGITKEEIQAKIIYCENEKNVWIPKEYSSLFIEEEKEEE